MTAKVIIRPPYHSTSLPSSSRAATAAACRATQHQALPGRGRRAPPATCLGHWRAGIVDYQREEVFYRVVGAPTHEGRHALGSPLPNRENFSAARFGDPELDLSPVERVSTRVSRANQSFATFPISPAASARRAAAVTESHQKLQIFA
jgi:hypothetical protein